MKFDDLSLSTKLNVMLTGIMVLLSVVLAIALSSYMTRTLEERSMAELKKTNLLVVDMVDAYNGSLEQAANRLGNLFSSYFPESFTLDEQASVNVGERKPTLRSGGAALNQLFPGRPFWRHHRQRGLVFARKGDGFVRVTTSLKKRTASGPSEPCWTPPIPAMPRSTRGSPTSARPSCSARIT
jgi:hypothetical protein